MPLPTLEDVFAGAGYADIDASPLQLAICRAAQGRTLDGVLSEVELERFFGVTELPTGTVPRLVALICGVRSGKSFIASAAALCGALTADLSRLKSHEVPRFAIIADRVDTAEATFRILLGILQGSSVLRRFIDGEPTAESVILRRPDGRRVEICVVAASRGGATVRNRWLVGFILEEVAQIGTEAVGHAVNAEEILRAAETRLLPGCTGWLISSPYGPQGLLYETWKRHFGRPGRVLVVRAPTRSMNPSFSKETIDEIARESPDVALREYGAEWIDADSAFLGAALVDPAIRKSPLIRSAPGVTCYAGMDPATRGNAWTLVVAWRSEDRKRYIIGGAWQWIGSKSAPLSPKAVLQDIKLILYPYGVHKIGVDAWAFDAIADHARVVDLDLVQHPTVDRDAGYAKLKALLGNGALELPPDPVLRGDLITIKQKGKSGGVSIELPKTTDGRHCDYAPSVALGVLRAATERELPRGMIQHSLGIM